MYAPHYLRFFKIFLIFLQLKPRFQVLALIAGVAQLIERLVANEKAAGLSPVSRSKLSEFYFKACVFKAAIKRKRSIMIP